MPKAKVPGYLLHKPTGQARVRINGKDHWLGKYGSPESHDRYSSLILEWQQAAKEAPSGVTFGQLSQMYRKHAERHYRKNGKETSEVGLIRYSLKRMNKVARSLLLSDISPRHLKQARDFMVREGLPRETINRFVQRIRRCVKEPSVPKVGSGNELLLGSTRCNPIGCCRL